MEIFDNVNKIVKSDLEVSIERGSRISIAAACFSIYAYQALRKQLDDIEELRFIFTSPTFVKEKSPREKREFYIPRLNRERSLYGTEFERPLNDWRISLTGLNLDKVWEEIIAQIGGVTIADGNTLDEHIIADEQRAKMLRRVEHLEKQARAEKQPRRKWELAAEARRLKEQMEGM